MADRHMVPGLVHKYAGIPDEKFFQLIDSLGGWPVGYMYVGFEHSDERAAGFCNAPHNSGWWTVTNSADDYYMWKLSPAAVQRIVDAAVSAIRLPCPIAHKLSVRGWSGLATLQKPEAAA